MTDITTLGGSSSTSGSSYLERLIRPQTGTLATSGAATPDLIASILSHPDFQDAVQYMVESNVLGALYSMNPLHAMIDNPFDAVYLADLQPDPVDQDDIARILNFADILDLSETISFNDGWDD